MPYHKYMIEMRWRKGGGGSNLLSVSGLEAKRTNSRNMSRLIPVAESELSCFLVKFVIITSEFAIVIKVTIFSCDGLVIITTEFAIIIEVVR